YRKKPNNLFATIEENCNYIKNSLNETGDLEIDDVTFQNKRGKLVYLHTVADIEKIEKIFFQYLKEKPQGKKISEQTEGVSIHKINNLQKIIELLVEGMSILLLENQHEAYVFDTPIEMNRSPDEPDTEKTVRGSHMGF